MTHAAPSINRCLRANRLIMAVQSEQQWSHVSYPPSCLRETGNSKVHPAAPSGSSYQNLPACLPQHEAALVTSDLAQATPEQTYSIQIK
ncbi:unnamed protein product [Arctogadus glacialis]